jgi:hypothetical protein
MSQKRYTPEHPLAEVEALSTLVTEQEHKIRENLWGGRERSDRNPQRGCWET